MARQRDARGRFTSSTAGNPNSWRRNVLSAAMSIIRHGGRAASAFGAAKTAYNYGVSKFNPVGKKQVRRIEHSLPKKKAKKKIPERKRKSVCAEVAQSTQTGFRYTFKKARRRVNDHAGWKYIQQGRGSSVVACNEGQQAYFAVQPILSVLQMNAASSSVSDAFDMLPWDMNPYRVDTGSAKFTVANTDFASDAYKSDTVYLSKVSGFMDVINNTATNTAFVDVYWCVARSTSIHDTASAFTSAITDDSFAQGTVGSGQTASAQVTGIAAGTTPTAGYITANTYGVKPTQFRSFLKEYKVIKKDNLVLAPGEQRRTYATFHYNENQTIADWKNIYTSITSNLVKANRTVYPLVVFRGAACVAADTAGGSSERITYSRVEVGANYQWTYHWHAVKSNPERFSYTRVNPYFLSDAQTGAVERTMTDEQKIQTSTGLSAAITTQDTVAAM